MFPLLGFYYFSFITFCLIPSLYSLSVVQFQCFTASSYDLKIYCYYSISTAVLIIVRVIGIIKISYHTYFSIRMIVPYGYVFEKKRLFSIHLILNVTFSESEMLIYLIVLTYYGMKVKYEEIFIHTIYSVREDDTTVILVYIFLSHSFYYRI